MFIMPHLPSKPLLLASIASTLLSLTACQTVSAKSTNQTTQVVKKVDGHNQNSADQPTSHSADQPSHEAHWGYGEHGTVAPMYWGHIKGNQLCKTGKQQSPINVAKVVSNSDEALNIKQNYHSQNFTAKNNGHTVVFTAQNPAKDKLIINGKIYKLLQFHYHSPSEHTIMGQHYPLEIHFVHKSADNQLAVVGVMYKVGFGNAELEKVVNKLTQATDGAENKVVLSDFNIDSIMPTDSQTYAYSGSLTTPPCSEQVQWLLKAKTVNISSEQLKKFTSLYKGNNRPVQPQGTRKVNVQ